jgi:hypothetical protein
VKSRTKKCILVNIKTDLCSIFLFILCVILSLYFYFSLKLMVPPLVIGDFNCLLSCISQ